MNERGSDPREVVNDLTEQIERAQYDNTLEIIVDGHAMSSVVGM